jgi:hypothetical protein
MQSEKYCSRMLSVPFFFKRPLVHHQLSGGKNKEKKKDDAFCWIVFCELAICAG